MFKLSKLLIKRSFKTLFNTKLFSVLIMFLIFISGTAFTMLSSSANAFQDSYSEVVNEGNLHDYVIKENFQFSKEDLKNSKLNLSIKKDDGTYSLVDDNFDLNKLNDIGANYKSSGTIDLSTNTIKYRLFFEIDPKNPPVGKIYQSLDSGSFHPYIDVTKKTGGDGKFTEKDLNKFKQDVASLVAQIRNTVKSNLSKDYVDKIRRDYGSDLYVKDTRSLYVLDKTRSFKVVKYEDKIINNGKTIRDLNNLIVYDGSKHFTENISDDQFSRALKSISGVDSGEISSHKIFKQTYSTGTRIYSLTDPNAFQAIVSPAYANSNGKEALNVDYLAKIFSNEPELMDKTNFDIEDIYIKYDITEKNVIFVGSTPYFIIGIGTTPDFAYPIIDAQVPVVNAKNQAVVFVSDRGYKRIFDAFRTNPQENYASLRFKENISDLRKEEILKEIDAKTSGAIISDYPKSIFPKGINLITKFDAKGDQILLTQERATALPKIKNTISIISYTTSTLLVIFVVSIIALIFKVLIAGSRKVYATMHSLGYSKSKIAASNALAGIALASIPSVLGYAVGYGLQFAFISFFDSMWTIPTYVNSFSWFSLLIMLVIPTLIVSAIIFISTVVELRYPIPSMLSDNLSKITWVEKITTKMGFVGAKSKYVIALTLKNAGKLSLVTLSATIALMSLIIGIGTIGKADNAYNATSGFTNYQFAIDLASPTTEGGQYKTLHPYDSNRSNSLPSVSQYHTNSEDINANISNFRKNVKWHIANASDGMLSGTTDQTVFDDKLNINFTNSRQLNQTAQYLRNILQTKFLLQENTNGIKPWEIAERLMPENQKNIANENFKSLINKLLEDGETYDSATLAKKYSILQNSAKNSETMPYIISYNNVIIGLEDELYTYIKASILSYNSNITVRGVDLNTKMVNLSSKSISKLNSFKDNDNSYQTIPIVINKYLKKNWKVGVGDNIEFDVTNYADRYQGKSHLRTRFHIVDIINTYNDSGIYTTKKIANRVLGLGENNGFNGVFSKSSKPLSLSTLPLYSESGIYTGTDSYSGKWIRFLDNYLKTSSWNNPNIKTSDEFVTTYSTTPYVSLISNVRWKKMDEVLFKNITNLSSSIINIIEAISITLSVVFTLIIASLMFRINKKKIATLWILGYRKREINRIFMSMYIVPMFISIAAAIPLSIGILIGLETFIINFGHVLIPLNLEWWIPIVSVIPIIIIFAVSTTVTIYKQRNSIALVAFKGD